MAKRREKDSNGQMSMSTCRRLAVQKELTDVQSTLCAYFNQCFLKSKENPITMARWITKEFDVKKREKKKK